MATAGKPVDDDDWSVACSDDEKYTITPQDMRELFEKMARNERLELEWKCPGRRPPTPERQEENMEVGVEQEQEVVSEQKTVPAAFDFSEPSSEVNTVTPMRTPGSTKTPRSNQKRVARLDKIMDDMIRHRKLDEEAAMSERLTQRK
jgi:PAXIP1-associated protein 1